jgi:hypothetical protein
LTKKLADISIFTYLLGYVSGYGCFLFEYVICKYVIRTLPLIAFFLQHIVSIILVRQFLLYLLEAEATFFVVVC